MNESCGHLIAALAIAVGFGLVTAAALGFAPRARAASPIYVRTDGDDATCNGLHDAPASSAPDCAFATIRQGVGAVDGGGTIMVGVGVYPEHVSIYRDVVLRGAGAGVTILDGGGNEQVVYVSLRQVAEISGVTICNGSTSWGGGIRNKGTLTLTSCMIGGNSGVLGGGGIYNSSGATLVISDSTVISNTSGGEGGGIRSHSSTLTIANSAIVGNTAGDSGGGIMSTNGTLTLVDSAVSGNQVTGTTKAGGGIFNDGSATLTNVVVNGNACNHRGGGVFSQGPLTLTNVTISANRADDFGGGVIHTGAATMTVVNCTVVSNSVSDGAGADGIQLHSPGTFQNTLLAHNDHVNCSDLGGSLLSLGHNLDSGNSCGFAATGDITDTNPLIDRAIRGQPCSLCRFHPSVSLPRLARWQPSHRRRDLPARSHHRPARRGPTPR